MIIYLKKKQIPQNTYKFNYLPNSDNFAKSEAQKLSLTHPKKKRPSHSLPLVQYLYDAKFKCVFTSRPRYCTATNCDCVRAIRMRTIKYAATVNIT